LSIPSINAPKTKSLKMVVSSGTVTLDPYQSMTVTVNADLDKKSENANGNISLMLNLPVTFLKPGAKVENIKKLCR